jgi:hypothetical protein
MIVIRVLGAKTMAAPLPASLRVAFGLAYVCGHLAELRQTLQDNGCDPSTPISRLLRVCRAGPPPADDRKNTDSQPSLAELLDEVHTAVQAAGDILGVYVYDESRSVEPAGVQSVEIVYRCPLNLCAGRSAREAVDAHPVCSLGHRLPELLRERLL